MRLAVFQPDIAANLGTICRTAACLGVPVDVILPCGFPFSEKAFRRAAMDYADHVRLTLHDDWEHFADATKGRLVLMTTKSATPLSEMTFSPDDTLLLGRESAGVPESVHSAADARILIPMQPGLRSLNVAVSAGIALYSALQQGGSHPITPTS